MGVTDRRVTALKVLRGFRRFSDVSVVFRIRFLVNDQESDEKFSEPDVLKTYGDSGRSIYYCRSFLRSTGVSATISFRK